MNKQKISRQFKVYNIRMNMNKHKLKSLYTEMNT